MADIFDQIAPARDGAQPPADIFDRIAASGVSLPPTSGLVPHPDEVDRVTAAHAQAVADAITRPAPVPGMERLGGVPPGPAPTPALPVPWETRLQTELQPEQTPGMITGKMQTDIPNVIMNSVQRGAGRVASGVEQMAEPGGRTKAGGLHEAIGGGFELATPAMMGSGAAAPIKTGLTVAAAIAAQHSVTLGLKYLGLPAEYADVAGDLTGIIAGAVAHGKISKAAIRETVEPILKERAEKQAEMRPGLSRVSGDIFDQVAAKTERTENVTQPEPQRRAEPQAESATAAGREPDAGPRIVGGRPAAGPGDAGGQPARPEAGRQAEAAELLGPRATPVSRETQPPTPREAGWVGNIPTSEINVDAPRFQFKANVGQGGAGEELRGVTKYDPEKAGVTAVWKDPANGKTYVVNGHHRVELAQRTQHPEMTVRYLDAKTAQDARLKGALINIAEGRGESTDAAKVFRDSGMTPAELEADGVSLKGKVAREGLALSNLAQPIFDDVIAGDLTPARGAVIGEGVKSHADQQALYDLIKQRERGGKRQTNDQLEELIRLNNRTATTTESTADAEQGGLFGAEEMTRSLLPEKAEVSDYVRKQLSTEKRLFGTVASQSAAERLAEGGNVINASDNAQIAERAGQGAMLYDRLSTKAGPIDGILDRAAQRLANGENANEAKQQAYREIRDYLTAQVRELTGVPEGRDSGVEGLDREGARDTGPGQHAEAADVAPPLSVEEFSQQAADAYEKHKSEGAHIGDALTKEIQFGRGKAIGNVEESPLFGGPAQEDLFGEPPARGNPERGGISAELLTLGAGKFWTDDVAPAISEAAKTVLGSADDILKVLAPQLRSEQAHSAGLILRNRLSELARRYDRSEAAMRQAKRAFDRMEPTQNYEFIRRVEAGEAQPAPELDAIAKVFRTLLDGRRRDVQALGKGKLQRFYENYFPHVWKDPKRAAEVFASVFGRRPLEGGKSFLKQRTHLTFEDGLNAGLKPVSNNPVDLVMLKVREMDRYIMAHQVLGDWKQAGLARFIDAREGHAPAGWKKIDDPIGAVYGPSVQDITEYPNRGLWQGLDSVAKALGIEHERGFLNLRGAIGRASQVRPEVKTLHGTAEDVLAHEIGHQIDFRAGSGKRFVLEYPDAQTATRLKSAYAALKDKTSSPEQRTAARAELRDLKGAIADRKQFKQELRDLADLRESGSKEYRRSRAEKMAQLAEMWVGSRELFEKTAPHVFAEWKRFLDDNPKLHALRDIAGDTEVEPIAQPYDVGGLVIRGHYWAPEGAARILNNHLSPGLRTTSGAYRVLLGTNNVLNQFQLGLSAFHLGFTSADAAVSKGALAVEQALRGKPVAAAKSALQIPIAPFSTAIEGNRVLREWYKPGSEGAPVAAIVDALEKGGGRARMDEFYQTHIGEKMAEAFRSGNLLGGILRAPFAGVEAVSNAIMKHIVPRQKLGVFADLARLEMERLGKDATVEQIRDVMAKAWDSVENRMGQMTYDNLFWNRTAKDIAMLGVRSVGWNIGTIREIGGAGVDALKLPVQMARGKAYGDVNLHRLSYVISLALTSAAMGAIYQYLATGKGPDELKDYYFPKTGELDEAGRPQRMSLPTYVKDVYHYATDPGKTIAGKASPLVNLFAEMARNQDFYGTRIRNEDDPFVQQMADSIKHVGETAKPFGIRNFERETKLQAPLGQRAQQFVGITPAPAALEKTKAETLASEIAKEGVPGGRTKEQAARREEESTIRRLARMGKPVRDEVAKGLRDGTITAAEARQAITQAKMDPLSRTFKGLTLEQALRVWKQASADERRRLRPLLAQKGKTLAAKPPAEREILMPQLRAAIAQR